MEIWSCGRFTSRRILVVSHEPVIMLISGRRLFMDFGVNSIIHLIYAANATVQNAINLVLLTDSPTCPDRINMSKSVECQVGTICIEILDRILFLDALHTEGEGTLIEF